MAYIGKEPIVGNFQVCDAISVVNGQAAYTMQVSSVNVVPESANHMLVSLNGILQKPNSSFTVSGSTITFASNLATGDVIDFIMLLGNVLDLGVPSDDTVTAAKASNNFISGQTELATAPADTDEFLVSDAGTLKRIDYSLIKGGGITMADQWRLTANITSNQEPITSNLERNDSTGFAYIGSGMSESSGIFTFPETGIYEVKFTLAGYPNTNDDIFLYVQVTTNNSSYSDVSRAVISRDGNGMDSGTASTFVDVTDTSNVKVRFSVSDISSGTAVHGSTSENRTHFTFVRLGDT